MVFIKGEPGSELFMIELGELEVLWPQLYDQRKTLWRQTSNRVSRKHAAHDKAINRTVGMRQGSVARPHQLSTLAENATAGTGTRAQLCSNSTHASVQADRSVERVTACV